MMSQTMDVAELHTWLIDSGCTSHMTKHLELFSSLDKTDRPKVKLGNGHVLKAQGRGSVKIESSTGTKLITEVLYIPNLDQNLLSVAQLLRHGYNVLFKG